MSDILLSTQIKRQGRVALCCSEDSYIPYCIVLYEYFVSKGFDVDVFDIHADEASANFSPERKQKWNFEFVSGSVESISLENLSLFIERKKYLFIFFGIPGHFIFKFRNDIYRLKQNNRQAIFSTGFPGIQHYTRFSGVMNRSGVDILFFIDPSLYRMAQRMFRFLPFTTAQCLLLGSPRISNVREFAKSTQACRYILFFEQNIVPNCRSDRQDLARMISDIGKYYSDKRVLVVRRNRPGERSAHLADEENRIERILAESGYVDFELFDGNWIALKDDIFLAIAVSSTALLEAAAMGVPSFSILFTKAKKTNYDAGSLFLKASTQFYRVPWNRGIWVMRLGDVSKIFTPLKPEILETVTCIVKANAITVGVERTAFVNDPNQAKQDVLRKIGRRLDGISRFFDQVWYRYFLLFLKVTRRLRENYLPFRQE